MNKEEYYKIHKKNLSPLNIKIDVELFENQIKKFLKKTINSNINNWE